MFKNNDGRKGEAGKRFSPRLPCSPVHLPPPRGIHLPQPVAARNPVSGVLGRGNVTPRGLNTLFLERLIDKQRHANQDVTFRTAFHHYIHYLRIVNANVPIFRHRFSKRTEHQQHSARLGL
ncbi:hypothetical protein TRVL_05150 [Trypanosoma vivax]|nr:hypothetical protein TRVL_05150 [Trypanosoma vivax]